MRIGTQEREEALAALAQHHAAGRLDADDYEDRRGRATDAVTRRELAELFDDLPEPRPRLVSSTDVDHPVAGAPVAQTRPKGPVSGPVRAARMLTALSPFIAVGLFLATGRWWWFLLIPAIAVIARNLEE
ncbi:hypothetical protein GCM10023258_24110 [Terrabacter aeriphilus]|uniref:DUF1707 domain-containing protein n=2 Tax=Terrabacter aeriphilus TaxID=515662 RepID=A0ABP9JDH4_9MICO